MKDRVLYRRRHNKVLMGLAGGLADYFRIDATVMRIILILLEFLTAGLLIILYFIVAFFVPKEPQ